MAEESAQDKTEEPTPKRQKQARDQGTIARSRELNTSLMLLVSGVSIWILSERIMGGLQSVARESWIPGRERLFDARATIQVFFDSSYDILVTLAPLMLITTLVALIAPVMLGGLIFSPNVLKFSLEKLNPLTNLKRILGTQGLVELGKALGKFAIIISVMCWVLSDLVAEFMGLGSEPLEQGIYHLGRLMLWTFIVLSSSLILIVLIDVPYQLWTTSQQLKMTFQEVKDDSKETEGSPEVKRRIRSAQLEISQRRMMANVPKADVVITNPTHFAVALRYDAAKMRAPVVVAKGVELVAVEIKRIARQSKVPILSSPALARAIFYSTELEKEIPVGLYKAVAMVLAYIVQIKAKKPQSIIDKGLTLTDVPIPNEFQRP